MKRSTFYLLVLVAIALALLVEVHTGHLRLFAVVALAPFTPALKLKQGQCTHVMTIYSDNPHSLLMTRKDAEQYARSAIDQHFAFSGRTGGILLAVKSTHIPLVRVVDYRMQDFPAHPGVGRVLAICERV